MKGRSKAPGEEMKKKASLAILQIYLIVCMIITPTVASAYIDPSTSTFLVEAMIGLGVAIAAGFAIYWRKAKKKINKVIGKEEISKDESDDLEDL